MGGRFITLEGIDGAGKSSHLEAIATHLGRDGAEVVRTREPGGTALAEALRTLVLHAPMDPMTESLLVFAARRDHIASVIGPAIARGATVLCDRFTDATFAYQGAGRGFDTGLLETLERWVQQGLQPQLTLWFDLDPALARSRLVAARESDRFEAQGLDFFERVRDGYRSRSAADPGRFARIDAAAERAAVSRQVIEVLEARGW